MIIVIIDSGVFRGHPQLQEDNIEEYKYDQRSRSFFTTETNDSYLFGHGTAIYGIVRACRQFARIINVRLEEIENGVEEELLVNVLRDVEQEFRPDILNLSLGVDLCEDEKSLYEICQRITERGGIIVSAFDNAGVISYPAAFDTVIGVISGSSCSRIGDFEYINDDVVNLAGKGGTQRVLWSSPEYLVIGGNSFACAHVTVQVARYISSGIQIKGDLLKAFRRDAIKTHLISEQHEEKYALQLPYSVKRAVLFPFNKEMHSLIRYQELLNFEITGVYDGRYSIHIGAETDYVLKESGKKNFLIRNIKDIDWETFDTLILGHVSEYVELSRGKEEITTLVNRAIAEKKSVYSFDEIQCADERQVFFPVVDKRMVPPDRFGMLYRISVPVVGVFGTSSRQGKFTLQLKLRELLLQQGYSVGQIGTEPNSLLFGMDYVFPIGYNANVKISAAESIRYLNCAEHELAERGSDIILVGGQSGTVPFDTGNVGQINLPQYAFLLGTLPDLCVICVNPYDEVDYIGRTIRFLESLDACEVVAIVVFPVTISNGWSGYFGGRRALATFEYDNIRNKLWAAFDLPVYELGRDQHMQELLDLILNKLT